MSAAGPSCDVPLLEYTYGELTAPEAAEVERHLAGCAGCAASLASMGAVRKTMAGLGNAPAPEAGLESLLAYAEQSARRAAAGPARAPAGWRRWVAPLLGAGAVAVLALVALPVAQQAAVPLPSEVASDRVPAAEAPPAPDRARRTQERATDNLGAASSAHEGDVPSAHALAVEEAPRRQAPRRDAPAAGSAGAPGSPPPARPRQVPAEPAAPARSEGFAGEGLGGSRAAWAPVTASAERKQAAPADALEAVDVRGGGGLGAGAMAGRAAAEDPAARVAAKAAPPPTPAPAAPRMAAARGAQAEADQAPPWELKKKGTSGGGAPEVLSMEEREEGAAQAPASPAEAGRMGALRRAVAEARDRRARREALEALCAAERAAAVRPAEGCERLEREFPPDAGALSR